MSEKKSVNVGTIGHIDNKPVSALSLAPLPVFSTKEGEAIKHLQSKIAALSIAVADNDIDEVKRLLPLSGEQVTNELNAKVGRLEDQLMRLQARLQERFEFVLGDIGTDLQAEYERSLDIINESGSQALSEIKADTVNNLFFPVAIKKMWTGYEVNLWLSEQSNQLRNPEQEKV